jgi:histidyl-tRNA synthetase
MQKKPGLREKIGEEKKPKLGQYQYKGPLKRSVKIAEHYGFTIVKPITITKRLPLAISKNKKKSLNDDTISMLPKGEISVLKKYIDGEMIKWPQPVMFCHVVNRSKDLTELRLEIIGTRKSIAEAIIIRTASVILEDLGYKDLYVALNSLGDKESATNFTRELTAYYRSHVNSLSPTLQQQFKKDVFRLLESKNEKCLEINKEAPKSIAFLSEDSRQHLREVLEFLESLNLHYEINTNIVRNKNCCPKTIFEIYHKDQKKNDNLLLARGERQNNLAQVIGFSKKIPIVSLRLNVKGGIKRKEKYKRTRITSTTKPKIYFIQLGFEAKLKSLEIIEIFRKTKVPIHQSLCRNSFRNQLIRAENTGVPYTIIMGQKEVTENSVIFRNMETRYQETVKVQELGDYLTKLKKRKVI